MADGHEGVAVESSSADEAVLDKSVLEENFRYWVSKWSPCKPPLLQKGEGFKLPTTTTFAYEKRWESKGVFPYRKILFEDKALLSERERVTRDGLQLGEPRREMSRARQIGLDCYVFAYLGVHDPYYADQTTFPNPPFGIFVAPKIEEFPKCNATRRDLASPDAEWPPNREFMLANDARLFSHYQVSNDDRHGEDFWHYWGGYEYWAEREYAKNRWTWSLEFHYRDLVDLKGVAAVLWPAEFRAVGPGRRVTSLSSGETAAFREENPDCLVIPYQWLPHMPTMSFIRASYSVARYFVERGRFPVDADEAWDVVGHEGGLRP